MRYARAVTDPTEIVAIAHVAAEIDLHGRADEVLARHALNPERWAERKTKLLEQLSDQLDRGDPSDAASFRSSYEQRRAELLGDLQAEAAPARASTELQPPPAGSVEAGSAPERRPDANVDPDATGSVDNRKVVEALRQRGIPFQAGSPGQAPAAHPLAEQSGETLLTDGRAVHAALAARGIAVGGREPHTAAPVLEAPSTAPASTPGVPDPHETGMIDVSKLQASLASGGVPFDPHRQPAPAPQPQVQGSDETVMAPVPQATAIPLPHNEAGATEGLELTNFQEQMQHFMAMQARGELPMSVERYAEVQAALAKDPDRNAVLARFGYASHVWHAVAAMMGSALNRSAPLRLQYDQLYRQALGQR